jgi:hypothetical protein
LLGVGLRSWQAFDRAVAEGYAHAAELIEVHGADPLMWGRSEARSAMTQWRRDLER